MGKTIIDGKRGRVMSVIIKDMDKADRCADCQLLQTYQEHPFASVEMWCGVTDERIDNMQMVLPTCPIIADRKTENSSEKPNNSTISKMEQVDEPTEITYQNCSDALLKMWMDNVLTDAEFNRIIDKLNNAQRKDEPQTERYCTNCKHNGVIADYECRECCGMDHHEFIEPQTDCPWK